MAKHVHEGVTYAPYGEGWARRSSADDEWELIDRDDVPLDVQIQEAVVRDRHENPPAPVLSVKRLPNPTLDAIAEELGLTPDDLRLRTNDTSKLGTNVRVSERRFKAIAEAMGMTVGELRARFGGRHKELRDPSRPGAL